MKKVLHVIDHIGGKQSESFLLKVYKNKNRFKTITPLFYSLRSTPYDPSTGDDLIISSIRNKWSILNFLELIKIVKSKNIKIVHLHLPKAIILGTLLKILLFKNLEIIIHEHGEVFQHSKWYTFFLRNFQNWTNQFIAVSELTKKELVKVGINKQKIIIIHNFIDLDKFNPRKQNLIQNRKKYDFPKNNLILAYIGRLVKMKNIDVIIKAIAILKSHNKNIFLIIIGDGPEKKPLMNLTNSLGLNNRVRFLGYRTDIASLISAIDIGCLVSNYESFGLPVLECLAMNKQVIMTNVGIAREVASFVEILKEKNLTNEIAKAIIKLSRNPKIWMDKNTLSTKYSVKNYFLRLEKIYNMLNLES